jgi:hypothetical protein
MCRFRRSAGESLPRAGVGGRHAVLLRQALWGQAWGTSSAAVVGVGARSAEQLGVTARQLGVTENTAEAPHNNM